MALIMKLWAMAWDLWEHHKEILHEQENIVTRTMGVQLNQQVAHTYRQFSELPLRHNDQYLLSIKLPTLLKKDVNYKETRLDVAEPALRQESKSTWLRWTRMRRMMGGMRKNLSAWLKR
jgi:hypothetical protein